MFVRKNCKLTILKWSLNICNSFLTSTSAMKASSGSSSLSEPPPDCICWRVGEFSAGMYGRSTLVLDSSSSSSKYLVEITKIQFYIHSIPEATLHIEQKICIHACVYGKDVILTHFPHQNLLFLSLFYRMMGADGSSHIPHWTLWDQMMCEICEACGVPLFCPQGQILQTQTLASLLDHLCSSSWLCCENKRQNKF